MDDDSYLEPSHFGSGNTKDLTFQSHSCVDENLSRLELRDKERSQVFLLRLLNN